MKNLIASAVLGVMVLGGAAYAADTGKVVTTVPVVAWPDLTDAQRTALDTALTGTKPGHVAVACGEDGCAKIAASIEAVFKARGWQVQEVRGVNLSHTQLLGARLDSCGLGADKMKALSAWVPAGHVTLGDHGPCPDPTLTVWIDEMPKP